MQKEKYQLFGLQDLAVGLAVTVIVAGLGSYVLSSVASQVSNVNTTIISNFGSDALKTMTQFLPVFAIGVVAISLIGLFMKGMGKL